MSWQLTLAVELPRLSAHVVVLPTLIDLCDISPPKGVNFGGSTIAPLLNPSADDWPDRILVTDSQRVRVPHQVAKHRRHDVQVATHQW